MPDYSRSHSHQGGDGDSVEAMPTGSTSNQTLFYSQIDLLSAENPQNAKSILDVYNAGAAKINTKQEGDKALEQHAQKFITLMTDHGTDAIAAAIASVKQEQDMKVQQINEFVQAYEAYKGIER